MARMPGATWRPVPNCTEGGQDAVYGVVLHIMEGTLDGSDSWFRNPQSQASSHFGVGKDGRIYQWVDTADRAWAQSAGNRTWLSIEHEGHGGDSLTAAQLAATARIIAWAHTVHGVPLQATDSVTGRGIGWHGMGGSAWGGHYDCPGNPIKAQRAAIIAAAKGGPPEDTNDMADITEAQMDKIADKAAAKVAGFKNPTLEPKGPDLRQRIVNAESDASDALAQSRANGTTLSTLSAKVDKLAVGGVDLDALAAKVAAAPALAEAIAEKVAQKVAARLQS